MVETIFELDFISFFFFFTDLRGRFYRIGEHLYNAEQIVCSFFFFCSDGRNAGARGHGNYKILRNIVLSDGDVFLVGYNHRVVHNLVMNNQSLSSQLVSAKIPKKKKSSPLQDIRSGKVTFFYRINI